MPEHVTLWSALFRYSMLAHDWSQAFRACHSNPVSSRRLENVRRLVRGMMECGALEELLLLPQQEQDELTEDATGTTTSQEQNSNLVNFYDVAAEALGQAAKDQATGGHASKAKDYFLALYSLYAHRDEWRLAAKCMNDWYDSILVLSEQNGGGRDTSMASWYNDAALASVSACNALQLVEDSSMQFLMTTDGRNCEGSLLSSGGSSHLLTVSDLDRRVLILQGICLLHNNVGGGVGGSGHDDAGSVVQSIAKSDIGSVESLVQVMEQLAKAGYYRDAVALALKLKDCPSVTTKDRSDALSRVACQYLVPAALGTTKRVGVTAVRPTRAQLVAQLETAPSLVCNNDGDAAMVILQSFVQQHASSFNTLAVDVTRTLLDRTKCHAKLPIWLTNLLLMDGSDSGRGGGKAMAQLGLFAMHNHKKTNSTNTVSRDKHNNTKHPVALMKLYMERGMLVEATDVVVRVLNQQHEIGGGGGAAKVPERGDIDFVPYAYVDTLYKMLQEGHHRQDYGLCQQELAQALKQHFTSLHKSEQGLPSARVLV
jgi:hypothetical protein